MKSFQQKEIALGKIIDEEEPFVLADEDKIMDDGHMQTINIKSNALFSLLTNGGDGIS